MRPIDNPLDWPVDVFDSRYVACANSDPEMSLRVMPGKLETAMHLKEAERRDKRLRKLGIPPLITSI